MSSSCSSLKLELADHIYQYLCHEAQHSDLPEAARESLTAASECIEQAYKLNHNISSSNNNNNVNNNNSSSSSNTKHHQQQIDCGSRSVTTSSSSAAASSSSSSAAAAAALAAAASTTTTSATSSSSPILPDELLRIFTRHKEILAQSKDPTINHHHHHHHHHLHHSSTSSSASNQKQQQPDQQQQQNESGAGTSGPPKRRRRLIPGIHRSSSIGVSVHQKNFKQKLIALIKKFRTDGSHFDSEEQYREALERELMKAAAGRGSRAIEELLEEEIDVEGESASEQEDWDNISETSTPKPSLRPFFSSTTLDKI